MIEAAAREASPTETSLFLLAMTEDVSWNDMSLLKDMQMGEQFNRRRRLFYYLLARKKELSKIFCMVPYIGHKSMIHRNR